MTAKAVERTSKTFDEPAEPPATDSVPDAAQDVPQHFREHYDAIREKEQNVRQLEKDYFDAKRHAKNAKEDFEAADLELRNLIADGLDPQTKLLFPAETEQEVDPDAWRGAQLNELFLPEKIFEKLSSAGIETIGQLEDLRAQVADGKADWPKGIGPSKVTAIEDSVLSWLSDHRDHWGEPVAASNAAGT
jgi:hypothetical protein